MLNSFSRFGDVVHCLAAAPPRPEEEENGADLALDHRHPRRVLRRLHLLRLQAGQLPERARQRGQGLRHHMLHDGKCTYTYSEMGILV